MPGRSERRRAVEQRQPEVVELDITESDWVSLVQAGHLTDESAQGPGSPTGLVDDGVPGTRNQGVALATEVVRR
jgi:hypothetical protein